MEEKWIAKLENISLRYDKKEPNILEDFTLGIKESEIFCLLGESGCGKTTCLQVFGGFLRPDKGRVLIQGAEYTDLPPEKRPVATVFQSYALFPHMSVLANVSYGLKQKGVRRVEREELAGKYLDMVGLSAFRKRAVTELSGGQQQRVALARSLAIEPKLLLLDEPLSNLDAGLRLRIRDELKRLQKSLGLSMLFVTHDQEEAMGLSNRIGIMEKGKILQIGSGEELYRRPVNDYVRDFFGESVRPEEWGMENEKGRVESLSGVRGKEEARIVLKGEVVSSQFLAIMRQYIVKWEGQEIKVKLSSLAPFSEGEKVDLFFYRMES